jgi:hypothetical protein
MPTQDEVDTATHNKPPGTLPDAPWERRGAPAASEKQCDQFDEPSASSNELQRRTIGQFLLCGRTGTEPSV